MIFRFTARFEEGDKYHDVRVTVREAIPDPVFNLPSKAAWNGKDTLTITPAIANLAAIKASRDSIIHFAWTLSGIAVDTLWGKESLMLRKPAAGGELDIRLCMENGGAVACDSTVVTVALPVGLRRALRLPMSSRIGKEFSMPKAGICPPVGMSSYRQTRIAALRSGPNASPSVPLRM